MQRVNQNMIPVYEEDGVFVFHVEVNVTFAERDISSESVENWTRWESEDQERAKEEEVCSRAAGKVMLRNAD